MVLLYVLLGICLGAGIVLPLAFAWVQRYRVEANHLHQKCHTLQSTQKATQEALQSQQDAYREVEKAYAVLDAEKKHVEELSQEAASQRKAHEEKLLLQFERLSQQLLDKKEAQLAQHSKHQMDHFAQYSKKQMEYLLAPLKDRITAFHQEIKAHREVSLQSQGLLKQEFERVYHLYDKMREEHAQAAHAILGDNKLQGHWGEMHALQMLENSGLKKGDQYVVQEGFTSKEGKRYIPDIIIKLPEKRHIVMDVKISLLHYTKFFNATDPQTKASYLKKHVQSLRNHIKQLGKKNYAQAYKLEGLDFVLLLLPLEPAFAAAIQEEPSLFQEAYEQHVVLTSPTTLRATLSMIEQLWTQHHQNQHALEIAEKSGALYDKFAGFIEDLKKIGQHLEGSQKSYEQALKKLCTGKGNLLNRTLQLKALGAKASKEIDASLVGQLASAETTPPVLPTPSEQP